MCVCVCVCVCQHRMRWEGEASEGGKFLKALTNAANSLYRSDLVVPQVLFLFCGGRPFVQGHYDHLSKAVMGCV